MDKVLEELTDRLKKALDSRLVSVVLYGSAAAGDYHGAYSDLNILCVLTEVTPRELAACGPIFRWWREHGNPAPLLLGVQEVRTSTDCFPIEFHDIQESNRLLFGEDVTTGLTVERVFYRAQVEHELRAKLLRLRQKAAGVLGDKELLLRLLIDSVSTFCVLARHALRLHGRDVRGSKREVISGAAEAFGLDAQPFATLLDLREGKRKPKEVEPAPLFATYLKEIQALVDAVDGLSK